MKEMMKRMTALVLALALIAGQVVVPTSAEEEAAPSEIPTVVEIDIPTVSGGETNEKVEVEITVSQDSEGNVVAEASTPEGGDTTDSGLTVEVESTVVTDTQGTEDTSDDVVISEDTTYKAEGEVEEDGTTLIYNVEGGTETTTEQAEDPQGPPTNEDGTLADPDDALNMEVDLYDENGELKTPTSKNPIVVTDSTVVDTTEPQPTNEGDKTQAEDPANFDQTTVTTSREAELKITGIQVESGDILFTDKDGNALYRDENGNPIYVDPDTGDYVNANSEKIEYTPENGTGWQWMGFQKPADGQWNTTDVDEWFTGYSGQDADGWGWYAKGNRYLVDAEDNKTYLGTGGLALRWVENLETGEKVGGLYCVDANTGNTTGIDYRLVNLEEATMEGYFDEEEAKHLRFVMENGYYTDVSNAADEDEKNLNEMKTRLLAAQKAGELNLSVDEINALTIGQAISATGMAVWQYGNRYTEEKIDPAKGEKLLLENSKGDTVVQRLYEYLISGKSEATDAATGEAKETQVINQEKFVESMDVVVGAMVKSDDANHANNDDNHDNDVYDVSLKFSLVVEPDEENDDLIVKILDKAGNEVKSARIAGTAKENENLDYLHPDADGNYILSGLQLAENTNAEFNLKLEGTQFLEEGVYVFTADKPMKEAIPEVYAEFTTDEKWYGAEGEQIWAFNKLKSKGKLPAGVENASDLTKEQYLDAIPYLYYGGDELRNADGSWNGDVMVNASQNMIGKFETNAQVDVGMKIDLTFNVEEEIVTTTRTWRSEETKRTPPATTTTISEEPETPTQPAPRYRGDTTELKELDNVTLTIEEEEVPLAVAPITGDESTIWGVVSAAAVAAWFILGIKRKHV